MKKLKYISAALEYCSLKIPILPVAAFMTRQRLYSWASTSGTPTLAFMPFILIKTKIMAHAAKVSCMRYLHSNIYCYEKSKRRAHSQHNVIKIST